MRHRDSSAVHATTERFSIQPKDYNAETIQPKEWMKRFFIIKARFQSERLNQVLSAH
jgi:hypothetical protein